MQQNSFLINDFFDEFYRKQLHRMKIFIAYSLKINKSFQMFSSNTNSNRGLAPGIIFISPDASTRHYNLRYVAGCAATLQLILRQREIRLRRFLILYKTKTIHLTA